MKYLSKFQPPRCLGRGITKRFKIWGYVKIPLGKISKNFPSFSKGLSNLILFSFQRLCFLSQGSGFLQGQSRKDSASKQIRLVGIGAGGAPPQPPTFDRPFDRPLKKLKGLSNVGANCSHFPAHFICRSFLGQYISNLLFSNPLPPGLQGFWVSRKLRSKLSNLTDPHFSLLFFNPYSTPLPG